jgi:polysaccharide biosynthesis transport protein
MFPWLGQRCQSQQVPSGLDYAIYLGRVRKAWKPVALSVTVAVIISSGVSLMLPKRYTATASLIIDPPAGNDPRAATALSPVYLESLKTYERVASSDTLFAHALLQCAPEELKTGRPIETLKRNILQVSKPQNTKILEIRATLRDPRAAQALAAYIAQQTVRLNQRIDLSSEEEITQAPRQIATAAAARLQRARAARDEFAGTGTSSQTADEIYNQTELKASIASDLARAQTDLAAYRAAQQAGEGAADAGEANAMKAEVASTAARVQQLTLQEGSLEALVNARAKQLEQRRREEESLGAEEKAAQAEYEAANNRLNEIVGSAAFTSERLHVLDEGVLPQRPSYPNVPVNVGASAVLALLACLFYLGVREESDRSLKLESTRRYVSR